MKQAKSVRPILPLRFHPHRAPVLSLLPNLMPLFFFCSPCDCLLFLPKNKVLMDTTQARYENAVLAEQCSEVFNAHPPLVCPYRALQFLFFVFFSLSLTSFHHTKPTQKVYERRAGVYLEVPDEKMEDFKRSLAGLPLSPESFHTPGSLCSFPQTAMSSHRESSTLQRRHTHDCCSVPHTSRQTVSHPLFPLPATVQSKICVVFFVFSPLFCV